jgi:hypothetical protein
MTALYTPVALELRLMAGFHRIKMMVGYQYLSLSKEAWTCFPANLKYFEALR